MPEIHPTAVVDAGCDLADDVKIGPFCVIGPEVRLGPGTELREHVSISGQTTLGEQNIVWPGAVLGSEPQDLDYGNEGTELRIGDRNRFRECVTLHRGTPNDRGVTTVGSDNLLMAYSHLGHDATVGNHTIITNAVQLAGHVKVEDHVVIAGVAAVHHFATIGQYAFIGGLTRVVRDVPPFMKVEGHPATVRMFNDVGMRRHDFDEATIDAVKDTWRRLFSRSSLTPMRNLNHGSGPNGKRSESHRPTTIMEVVDELETRHADHWPVQAVLQSIRNSTQGVHGRYLEGLKKSREREPAPAT